MENSKNIIKAFILAIIITLIFKTLFEMFGVNNELAIVTILIFVVLICTYTIIDEIKRLKD